ncbi:hypothetical protein BDQ12DRAFT_673720 [Crucibulum laeve]|uniref:RRM domain-containing protein n=1 Tax=Crucibulum laeve TaxID=68775 RepID=A0A5C3MJM0_9AGAR|nr:hypothetical protein BDQ12DRAFT_673720 [Crucibulum laeve]
MASLLERLSVPATSATGPIRSKSSGRSTGPYNRANATRIPKGDVDSNWSHDLYEVHNSLSARLSNTPAAPRTALNPIATKAIRDAVRPTGGLSIKGASAISEGNVVDVSGLASGTTADDVAAIFKRCGAIASAKSVGTAEEVRIRVTFKAPASANNAVQKFDKQPADGKTLSVQIVGASAAGTTLAGRLGGTDGLGLVREEGSVDVLMDTDNDTGSKMRSDSLLRADPRARVLVAPPGANPKEYIQAPPNPRGGGRRGGGRGRGGRRGRRGGNGGGMDVD